MRDYINIAKDYARNANGKHSYKHGRWMKLACKRFIDDLKRAKKKDCAFYFSEEHAIDVCQFVERLQHCEGTWSSPYLILHDSMVLFYVQLFGFRKHSDDSRRFTNALWSSGRKNAKSTGIGAPIALYAQFEEGESGAQVVSVAPTSNQSRIVWYIAKRMVEKDKEFQDHYNCKPFAVTIAGYSNGSVFKYISSKSTTQDGLNPSTVICDEVHQMEIDLMNVVKSAAGARKSPLFLYLTTDGYKTDNSPWVDMKRYSQQILTGIVEADHFLTFMFCIDDGDEEYNPDVWIKANPLTEVNPYLKEAIALDAKEAEQMPSKAAEFRVKRLNKPSNSVESFVDLNSWNKCNKSMTLDELKGFPCWFSLDMSSNNDLTSIRGLWLVGGIYYTHGWRYCPSEALKLKTNRGGNLYPRWIEDESLIETDGKTINHDVIRKKIIELYNEYNPLDIVADSWNTSEIVRKLEDDNGIIVNPFIQGAKSYHPAIKKFEKTYKDEHLAHGNDELLKWCASNLIVKYNENANMTPDKKRSKDKIDDVITLIMCFGACLDYKPQRSLEDMLKNKISVSL